jgi:hypothetical protein
MEVLLPCLPPSLLPRLLPSSTSHGSQKSIQAAARCVSCCRTCPQSLHSPHAWRLLPSSSADNVKERLDKTMSGDFSVRQGQHRTLAEQTAHNKRHMYMRKIVGLTNGSIEDRVFSLPAVELLRRAKEAETPTSPSKTAKSKEPDPETPLIGTSTAPSTTARSGNPPTATGGSVTSRNMLRLQKDCSLSPQYSTKDGEYITSPSKHGINQTLS